MQMTYCANNDKSQLFVTNAVTVLHEGLKIANKKPSRNTFLHEGF